jgi:hypothetical protein
MEIILIAAIAAATAILVKKIGDSNPKKVPVKLKVRPSAKKRSR